MPTRSGTPSSWSISTCIFRSRTGWRTALRHRIRIAAASVGQRQSETRPDLGQGRVPVQVQSDPPRGRPCTQHTNIFEFKESA